MNLPQKHLNLVGNSRNVEANRRKFQGRLQDITLL